MNIIDKIWNSHVVKKGEGGAPDIFFIDLHLIHEVTSPQAFTMLREKKLPVFDVDRTFATIDHSIPTSEDRDDYTDENAKKQVDALVKNCDEFGVKLFDDSTNKQGIVHIIGPELGLTQPGKTIVCGDSHTATHGAFGAMAFGIGTSQVGHVLATQCLLLHKPKTMKVEFIGKPSKFFSPKDAILALIRQIGIQGGTGYAMEFCGEYIRNMSMEGRMTICNMAIESGSKYGLVSPDETTFEYVRGRKYAPKDFDAAVKKWKNLASDENDIYDKVVKVDITDSMPLVTWGTNPEQSVQVTENIPYPVDFEDKAKQFATKKSLDYTKLKSGNPVAGTPIDFVFIGSCTNGRIEDFKIASEILNGKKVANGVKAFFVPGSQSVKKRCEDLGYAKIFLDAGVDFRKSGCSMCLAMNGDHVPAGKRCASTSNRNFVGRQGVGSYTHLMSPLMAALCAVEGEIVIPETPNPLSGAINDFTIY